MTSTSRHPSPSRRLLGAWTFLVLLFLYLPIVLLVVYSFNSAEGMGAAWRGFTLKWYGAIWRDRNLVDCIENSLIIAGATTGISVVLGTLAAWLLHRYRFPGEAGTRMLLLLPMIVPEVIMGISLMLLYQSIGLDRGYLTVIIAHVTFCFPFVMASVQARLAGLDPSLEEAAMDLGATPVQAFFRVILPYLGPGILAGALLAFTLSLDEFVVTIFTYSASSITLPVKIYGDVRRGATGPVLNALSTLFIVATALLVVGADAVRGRKAK